MIKVTNIFDEMNVHVKEIISPFSFL